MVAVKVTLSIVTVAMMAALAIAGPLAVSTVMPAGMVSAPVLIRRWAVAVEHRLRVDPESSRVMTSKRVAGWLVTPIVAARRGDLDLRFDRHAASASAEEVGMVLE